MLKSSASSPHLYLPQKYIPQAQFFYSAPEDVHSSGNGATVECSLQHRYANISVLSLLLTVLELLGPILFAVPNSTCRPRHSLACHCTRNGSSERYAFNSNLSEISNGLPTAQKPGAMLVSSGHLALQCRTYTHSIAVASANLPRPLPISKIKPYYAITA
jgi:hypothetical protein